jgi:hypothetical protein
MRLNKIKFKNSYDFYLILATTIILFAICLISIYGMFYFKFAQINQMSPALKITYMNRMNTVISPFAVCLILLLGICVPKRLLPTAWLNRATLLLLVGTVLSALIWGGRASLYFILAASLILQIVVLLMALSGSKKLNFHKKGYWVRLGSSLIHLGLILFVLDLLLYEKMTLHLFLFWVTTGTSVLGMVFSFYAESVVRLITGKQNVIEGNK